MEIAVLLVGWGWSYPQLKAGWTEIEELGYDICYMGDDLFPHRSNVTDSVYEPWTMLPAIAATTERIKLGSLVSPAGRRHPGLFAKMTTNVDLISGGRLIVGRGLGNAPDQQRSLSQPFLPPEERTKMLTEEIEIMRSMWTQPLTTYEGKYFSVHEAINEPKPVSAPHPEVLIAFRSKTFLPRVAAEFANRVNIMGGSDEGIAKTIEVLTEHCLEFHRDVSEIVIGRCASIIFTDRPVHPDERDRVIEERAQVMAADPELLKWEHTAHLLSYVGPPADCAAALRRRTANLGVRELVLCIETIGQNSYERTMAGLRVFAAEVLPELKAA